MWPRAICDMQQRGQEDAEDHVQHPPRKLQSEGYTGPITLSNYEKFQHVREILKKEGITIGMPTGN